MKIIEINPCQNLYYSSQQDHLADFFCEDRGDAQIVAKIFIKSNEKIKKKFLFKLYKSFSLFLIFVEALETNSARHRLLEAKKSGASGLTKQQLSFEKHLLENLAKFPPNA